MSGTIFLMVKEFVAVMFQLVCYSRLHSFDLFNGPLVLYVTLIVFSFPFLNPYLFAVLRLGPWNKGTSWFGVIFQTFLIACAQCGGGIVAALISNSVNSVWSSSALVRVNSVVNGIGVEAGSMYIDNFSNKERGLAFLEEFVAVLTLLVGVIHLMECHAASLLKNRPSAVPPPPPVDGIFALPSELVFQVCVLVAGILCAFPSAHQAMHVSIFLEFSKEHPSHEVIWCRIGGGLVATICGVFYYCFVYLWSVEEGGTGHAFMELSRNPAYFNVRLAIPEQESARRRSLLG